MTRIFNSSATFSDYEQIEQLRTWPAIERHRIPVSVRIVAYLEIPPNLHFCSCVETVRLLRFSRTSAVRALQSISGLYLHSPASEGMWMGAHQKHTGMGVPAP